MTDKIFIDTNIWLYLFLQDSSCKYKIVEKYFYENDKSLMFISYQVINEVTNQLVRNSFNESVIRENIDYLYKICIIHNFSKDTLFLASSLRERYSFSFWDSMVVSSAINCGCSILASEDMQDGLKINNMIIRNIFRYG